MSQPAPYGAPVGAGDRKNLYSNPAAAAVGRPTGDGCGEAEQSVRAERNGDHPTAPSYQCTVDGCFRVLSTRQGLGQHTRHAHPKEYNSSINTNRTRARWCEEEGLRLAALEVRCERERSAQLGRGGTVKGINEMLLAYFPGRTLQAIKAHRRGPQYREMVRQARERMGAQSPSGEEQSPYPRQPSECDRTPVVTGGSERDEDQMEGVSRTPPRPSFWVGYDDDVDCEEFQFDLTGSTAHKYYEMLGNLAPPGLAEVAGSFGSRLTHGIDGGLGPNFGIDGGFGPNSNLTGEETLTGNDSGPGKDLDDAIMALAADLTLDVYGGKALRSIAEKSQAGEIKEDLEKYLSEYFVHDPKGATNFGKPKASKRSKNSKRKQRRAEYARVQNSYRKSRLRCAQEILDGPQENKVTDHQNFVDFWERTMTEQPPSPPLDVSPPTEILGDIWVPVTRDDVRRSLPPCSTATGPDGMTARELRGVPFTHLALIMNLILRIGEIPRNLALSRTTFIPKVPEASRPEDFRPIAVAPILIRMFHKILAWRVRESVSFDIRQRAFIEADGCGENIALLQALIAESRRQLRPLHMATMDLRKAFDSVSVDAVLTAARAAGFPEVLLVYLDDLYKCSSTIVQSGELKVEVKAARGVKQGDPLSPLLFNLVVDQLLKELPAIIGFRLGQTTINAMAFADDLTLVASTRDGLQELLDQSEAFFKARGLSFNPAKSSTLSLMPSGKQKKIKIEEIPYQVEGSDIPVLTCVASWKYLGITFDTRGRKVAAMGELAPLLERLTSAPLKPQQRLILLRHYLLPRLYHKGTFANLTAKLLRRLDTTVRNAVRGWLRLPHDTPVGYFHAPVVTGGLGIPALRHMLPRLKLKRIAMLRLSEVPACVEAVKCPALVMEERKATDLLTVNGVTLRTSKDVMNHWADLLHNSVDGGHLRECASVPESQAWVADGTRLLSGRDFVDCTKLRINAIPTLARSYRGREKDTRCRAGCQQNETLGHVLQQCHRTHGARIKRHDGIVAYLCQKFHKDGWQVEREPLIKTREGARYPDIVIRKTDCTAIVDVQVVGTSTPLDTAHRRKRAYYARNDEVVQYARKNLEGQPIVTSCTVSYRGVWSTQSRTDLRGLGINKNDAKLISVRALQGSLAVYGWFRRSTSRRVRPTGGRMMCQRNGRD